jgi:hypothetical protein
MRASGGLGTAAPNSFSRMLGSRSGISRIPPDTRLVGGSPIAVIRGVHGLNFRNGLKVAAQRLLESGYRSQQDQGKTALVAIKLRAHNPEQNYHTARHSDHTASVVRSELAWSACLGKFTCRGGSQWCALSSLDLCPKWVFHYSALCGFRSRIRIRGRKSWLARHMLFLTGVARIRHTRCTVA